MDKVYVFPGQGAQFSGMGKELYEQNAEAKVMFERANEILGFRITDIMFEGTAEELKQTKVTQPAVFLHSVILAKVLGVEPSAVAGHSLGEFSALVVSGALSFEEGLQLVAKRAMVMQRACEMEKGVVDAFRSAIWGGVAVPRAVLVSCAVGLSIWGARALITRGGTRGAVVGDEPGTWRWTWSLVYLLAIIFLGRFSGQGFIYFQF